MTNSSMALQGYDLSNPKEPLDLGIIGWGESTSILSFAGNAGTMFAQVYNPWRSTRLTEAIEFAPPGAARIIGQVETSHAASGMRVHGTTLFTLGYGVTTVTIADPTSLREIGHYDLLGAVGRVAALPGRVYTACVIGPCPDGQILRTFDPSTPTAPRQVVVQDIGAPIADLAATDSRVLALTSQVLHVFTAPRADSLQQEAILPFSDDWPEALAAFGDRAVLVSRQKRLTVVDLAAAGGPQIAGTTTLDMIPAESLDYGAIRDIAVSDDRAFIALSTPAALLIADIADPAAPRIVSQVDLSYAPEALAARGDLVLVAGGDQGLRIIRVAPGAASEIGSLPLPGANAVALDGPNAYVASANGMVYAIDITDPAVPQLAASRQVVGTPAQLSAAGGSLWLAAREGGLYGFGVR